MFHWSLSGYTEEEANRGDFKWWLWNSNLGSVLFNKKQVRWIFRPGSAKGFKHFWPQQKNKIILRCQAKYSARGQGTDKINEKVPRTNWQMQCVLQPCQCQLEIIRDSNSSTTRETWETFSKLQTSPFYLSKDYFLIKPQSKLKSDFEWSENLLTPTKFSLLSYSSIPLCIFPGTAEMF